MKNIFVICAWQKKARLNFQKTILNSIPDEMVFPSFPEEKHALLKSWRDQAGGFYAWGLKSSQRSLSMWSSLEPGDCVVSFFGGRYRTVARVAGKEQNDPFAEDVWGVAPGSDELWRNIIFMTKPLQVDVAVQDLLPHMSRTYRGAVRIGSAKILDIIRDFGSVESFVKQKFDSVATPV
jgi:hypothetical protein